MRELAPALALSLVGLFGAGCFERPQSECAFLCGDDGECPESYACAPDGWCKRDDVAQDFQCPNAPIDAGIDAPVTDAARDAGPPDAGVDAAPPDAAVDAAPPDAACGGTCIANETCNHPDCLCNGDPCSTTATSGQPGTFACGAECTYQCNSGTMDTCELTNVAEVSCSGAGDCSITCADGTGDCNFDESDGCEADLTADTTCGPSCTDCTLAGLVCDGAGSCVAP